MEIGKKNSTRGLTQGGGIPLAKKEGHRPRSSSAPPLMRPEFKTSSLENIFKGFSETGYSSFPLTSKPVRLSPQYVNSQTGMVRSIEKLVREGEADELLKQMDSELRKLAENLKNYQNLKENQRQILKEGLGYFKTVAKTFSKYKGTSQEAFSQKVQEEVTKMERALATIESQGSELKELQSQIKKLSQQMGELKNAVTEIEQERASLNEGVEEPELASEELNKLLGGFHQVAEKVQKQASTHLAELEKINQQQAELIKCQENDAKAQEEIERLQKEISEMKKQQPIMASPEEIAMEMFGDGLEGMSQGLEGLANQLQQLSVGAQKRDKTMQGQQETLAQLTEEIKKISTELQSLKQQQEGLVKQQASEVGVSKEQQQITSQSLEELKKQFQTLNEKVEVITSGVTSCMKSLQTTIEERIDKKTEESKQTVEELQKLITTQQAAIEELTRELKELQEGQKVGVTKITKEQAAQAKKFEKTVEELQQRMEAMGKEMDTAMSKRMELEAKKIQQELLALKEMYEGLVRLCKDAVLENRQQKEQLVEELRLMREIMEQQAKNLADRSKVSDLTGSHDAQNQEIKADIKNSQTNAPELPAEEVHAQPKKLQDRKLKQIDKTDVTYKRPLQNEAGWLEARFWKAFFMSRAFWVPFTVAVVFIGLTITIGTMGIGGPILLGLMIMMSTLVVCGTGVYYFVKGVELPEETFHKEEEKFGVKRQVIYNAYYDVHDRITKETSDRYFTEKEKKKREKAIKQFYDAFNVRIDGANLENEEEKQLFKDLVLEHANAFRLLVIEENESWHKREEEMAHMLKKLLASQDPACHQLAEHFNAEYPQFIRNIFS